MAEAAKGHDQQDDDQDGHAVPPTLEQYQPDWNRLMTCLASDEVTAFHASWKRPKTLPARDRAGSARAA
jgi:hypothetical protein